MYWLKIPSAIKTYLLTGDKKREDYEAMSLASLRIKTEQAAVNLISFVRRKPKDVEIQIQPRHLYILVGIDGKVKVEKARAKAKAKGKELVPILL